jgi:hypothetical protein
VSTPYHPAQVPPPQRVMDELRGWQEMAAMWPLTFSVEDGHARCEQCEQSVIPLVDRNGIGYSYRKIDMITRVVAHIRQVHDTKPVV